MVREEREAARAEKEAASVAARAERKAMVTEQRRLLEEGSSRSGPDSRKVLCRAALLLEAVVPPTLMANQWSPPGDSPPEMNV